MFISKVNLSYSGMQSMDMDKWTVCFMFIKLAAFSFTVIDAFSSKLYQNVLFN
jgi:hypothetical protein